MRVLVQKVKEASVSVDKKTVSSINEGLLLFVGFKEGDTLKEVKHLANKVLNLRIFKDQDDKMNLSIPKDCEILSISQFTLYGDAKKGNRPSFVDAMEPVKANDLYLEFNKILNESIVTKAGVFQAHMEVSLINDGPITILLEK